MSGFGLLFAGPIQGHYWFRYLDKVGWSCNEGPVLGTHDHAIHEHTAYHVPIISCTHVLPSEGHDHTAHATKSCSSLQSERARGEHPLLTS